MHEKASILPRKSVSKTLKVQFITTTCEFFTPALADSFPQESEW